MSYVVVRFFKVLLHLLLFNFEHLLLYRSLHGSVQDAEALDVVGLSRLTRLFNVAWRTGTTVE